jgi:hypothetical protein
LESQPIDTLDRTQHLVHWADYSDLPMFSDDFWHDISRWGFVTARSESGLFFVVCNYHQILTMEFPEHKNCVQEMHGLLLRAQATGPCLYHNHARDVLCFHQASHDGPHFPISSELLLELVEEGRKYLGGRIFYPMILSMRRTRDFSTAELDVIESQFRFKRNLQPR